MSATIVLIGLAFILSFSAPLFFIGRAGYKVRGFFSCLIIGIFSFILPYLIIIRPIMVESAGLNSLLRSFVQAISYSASCGFFLFVATILARQISKDLRMGFALGIGQALAASIITVLIPYFNSAFYLIQLSGGTLADSLISMGLTVEEADLFIDSLLSIPASDYVLSGAERMVFSIAHIAVGVFYGKYLAMDKKVKAAIVLFVPFFSVYLILSILGISGDYSLSYVSVTLMAIASIIIWLYMARREKPQTGRV